MLFFTTKFTISPSNSNHNPPPQAPPRHYPQVQPRRGRAEAGQEELAVVGSVQIEK